MMLRIFGKGPTLIWGDSMVLDRWRWLKRYLPRTADNEAVIDIGCGTGAFTLAAAKRGYQALGLSWDKRNQAEASRRAAALGISETARFEIFDIRELDRFTERRGAWSYAICCENIEHIVDDRKVAHDIAALLAPGGRLLMTAPNRYYIPLNHADAGPFELIEDGRHVRKGYSKGDLRELLEDAGFIVESIEYCSGRFSQWFTKMHRAGRIIPTPVLWLVTLPFRLLPAFLDRRPTERSSPAGYSICAVAIKPRLGSGPRSPVKAMASPAIALEAGV